MQQVYTMATFHPRLDHSAPELQNSHGRVEKTVSAQAHSARFCMVRTPDELVPATRHAIADETAFDARGINFNFDYDYEADGEVN